MHHAQSLLQTPPHGTASFFQQQPQSPASPLVVMLPASSAASRATDMATSSSGGGGGGFFGSGYSASVHSSSGILAEHPEIKRALLVRDVRVFLLELFALLFLLLSTGREKKGCQSSSSTVALVPKVPTVQMPIPMPFPSSLARSYLNFIIFFKLNKQEE